MQITGFFMLYSVAKRFLFSSLREGFLPAEATSRAVNSQIMRLLRQEPRNDERVNDN